MKLCFLCFPIYYSQSLVKWCKNRPTLERNKYCSPTWSKVSGLGADLLETRGIAAILEVVVAVFSHPLCKILSLTMDTGNFEFLFWGSAKRTFKSNGIFVLFTQFIFANTTVFIYLFRWLIVHLSLKHLIKHDTNNHLSINKNKP